MKQRWSGLFGVKNPQQSQLCELLNNYSKNGVPLRPQPLIPGLSLHELNLAIQQLENLPKSWSDICHHHSMNENDMKIQTAIWELVTTEVDYIYCLQTVTDVSFNEIKMDGLDV